MAQQTSLLKKAEDTEGRSSFLGLSKDQKKLSGQFGLSKGFSLIDEGIRGFTEFEATVNTAENLEFQAKQEELIGEQQSLSALEALNDAQAANVVAAFASGLRLQGSVTRAQTDLAFDQAFITVLAKTNADIKAGALDKEANRLREEADYNKKVAPAKIIGGAILSYLSFGAF